MTYDEFTAVLTLWGEARGETLEGQGAVAHVIMNRRNDGRWGSTYDAVCRAPSQFSCWNHNDPNYAKMVNLPANDAGLKALLSTLHFCQTQPDFTQGAMFYYAASMTPPPYWVASMLFCGQFGSQRFYKERAAMPLTGYRTMIVSAVIAVVGALQGLDWVHLLPSDPATVGWVVMGLGAIMAVLRSITTTPMGRSEPE